MKRETRVYHKCVPYTQTSLCPFGCIWRDMNNVHPYYDGRAGGWVEWAEVHCTFFWRDHLYCARCVQVVEKRAIDIRASECSALPDNYRNGSSSSTFRGPSCIQQMQWEVNQDLTKTIRTDLEIRESRGKSKLTKCGTYWLVWSWGNIHYRLSKLKSNLVIFFCTAINIDFKMHLYGNAKNYEHTYVNNIHNILCK